MARLMAFANKMNYSPAQDYTFVANKENRNVMLVQAALAAPAVLAAALVAVHHYFLVVVDYPVASQA
jgi:hypothetical protein